MLIIAYEAGSQFCALKHSYNRRFFDFVKSGVKPLSYRRWNATLKCWEVHLSKLPLVVSFGKRHFDHVDYSSLPEAMQVDLVTHLKSSSHHEEMSHQPQSTTSYEVLHLLPTAPPEVIRAAYKALAFLYHPDRGGDPEAFKEVTQAYEELMEKVSPRS